MPNKTKKELFLEKIERDLEEEEKLRNKFEKELSDAKIHTRKGFIQRLQYERREAGLDGVVLKAQEVANLQDNELVQEEKLAAELGLIRQQEIKEEKLRQYLRENSRELKELETQLRSAYVNKILAAQMAENQAQKIQEQVLQEKAREALLISLGTNDEIEKRAMMFEKQMKEEYRRSLQDQIIEKERMKQDEFIAFMKEKKLFDDTVKKIKEEDEKERADSLLMKQKIREEMEQFHKAREVWKARERYLLDQENKKNEEFLKKKAAFEAANEKKKNEPYKKPLTEEHEEFIQRQAEERIAIDKLKEERMELMDMLRANEKEELERKKALEDLERNLAQRQEAKVAFKKLLESKDLKVKEEKKFDERFVKQMNLRVKEEEAREMEKEEMKKQTRICDMKYNLDKMKQNIQNHAESLKMAQIAFESEMEQERKKAEMIQEERIRILKQHAPHLLGYFPKGCLKEKDLEALGLTGNSLHAAAQFRNLKEAEGCKCQQ